MSYKIYGVLFAVVGIGLEAHFEAPVEAPGEEAPVGLSGRTLSSADQAYFRGLRDRYQENMGKLDQHGLELTDEDIRALNLNARLDSIIAKGNTLKRLNRIADSGKVLANFDVERGKASAKGAVDALERLERAAERVVANKYTILTQTEKDQMMRVKSGLLDEYRRLEFSTSDQDVAVVQEIMATLGQITAYLERGAYPKDVSLDQFLKKAQDLNKEVDASSSKKGFFSRLFNR